MVKVSFWIATFSILFSANGVALDGAAQASMSVTSTAKMRRASAPAEGSAKTPGEESPNAIGAEESAKTTAEESTKTNLVEEKLKEVGSLEKQNATVEEQQKEAADQAKAEDMKVFKIADRDGNGFIDAKEMTNLMVHAGLPPNLLTWAAFDHDKDDRLSPDEFLQAGPAVSAAFKHLQAAHNYRITKDRQIFHSFDKDHSGFLDRTEMAAVEQAVGLQPGKLNWPLFDQNNDGLLSEGEFLAAGPAVAAAIAEHVRNAGSTAETQKADQDRPDQAKPKPSKAGVNGGDDLGDLPEHPPPQSKDSNPELDIPEGNSDDASQLPQQTNSNPDDKSDDATPKAAQEDKKGSSSTSSSSSSKKSSSSSSTKKGKDGQKEGDDYPKEKKDGKGSSSSSSSESDKKSSSSSGKESQKHKKRDAGPAEASKESSSSSKESHGKGKADTGSSSSSSSSSSKKSSSSSSKKSHGKADTDAAAQQSDAGSQKQERSPNMDPGPNSALSGTPSPPPLDDAPSPAPFDGDDERKLMAPRQAQSPSDGKDGNGDGGGSDKSNQSGGGNKGDGR